MHERLPYLLSPYLLSLYEEEVQKNYFPGECGLTHSHR